MGLGFSIILLYYLKEVSEMTNINQIINWFRVVSHAQMRSYDFAEELGQVKVTELLYYVQGAYLALYGQRAFEDDILAGKYGPTIQSVQDMYGTQTGIVGKITAADLEDYNEIGGSSALGQVLLAVWQTYGDMSAVELSKQSRTEAPWQQTRYDQVISVAALMRYFKSEIVQ